MASWIDELQRAHETMTPGEWRFWSEEGPAPDGRDTYSVCRGTADLGPLDHQSCIATTFAKGGPEGIANACGIATLRNHAARVVAVLRAVEAAEADREEDREDRGKSTVTGEHWDRIVAALRGEP